MRDEYAEPGPIAGRILDAILDADPDARWMPSYAHEPDGNPVVVADWNRFPDRSVRILEQRYGWTTDWVDTTSHCSECGRCIQTDPWTLVWRPEFAIGDGEIICGRCLERSGLRYDDRERWPEILDPARLASVGVSADTLRPSDLAERFPRALRDAGRGVLSDAEWSDLEEWERGPRQTCPDRAGWYADAVEWMSDRLAECAPEGYSFGAHPGDGACFGFWEADA